MPYQCEDNFDEFIDYISKISDTIEESSCPHVCILGDFNAAVDTFLKLYYLSYVAGTVHIMSDYSILGRSSGTITYICDAHLTTSWLDHGNYAATL